MTRIVAKDTSRKPVPLLLIELQRDEAGFKRRTFDNFEEADSFLRERLERQSRFDVKSYLVHVVWEGGMDFRGSLELSYDLGGKILEEFIQGIQEDELLLPPTGEDMEEFVTRESFHVRRLTLNDERADRAKELLLSCAGLDSARFLKRKTEFEHALTHFSFGFPLMDPVITEGHKFLSKIHLAENRSTDFKKVLLYRQKFPLSLAVGYALQENEERVKETMGEARRIYSIFLEDASIVDERFTRLGQELYGLTALDVERLRDIQEIAEEEELPMMDDEVSEFLLRDREMAAREYPKNINEMERIFLRFYRQGYIFRGVRTARNRTDITLHAASHLRLFRKGIGEKDLERVILSLDPLSVHQPSYANGILLYMDRFICSQSGYSSSSRRSDDFI